MIPVILSGGSGSRLWPISRASYPKQFCDLFDEPLLTKTLKRLTQWGEPQVVTVQPLNVLTEKCLASLGLPKENVIYEPIARNTAPAIALLCWKLFQESLNDQVVGVFPADHMISNEKRFTEVVNFATECAEKGQVVTIGIKPDYPATGFGYIECQSNHFAKAKDLVACQVEGFREKPNLKTAEKFVSEKRYFWNAGMFIFKVDKMIAAFKTHMPELWSQVTTIKQDFSNLGEVYKKLEPVSIDFGIMEKIADQVCIPCDIGWSDLGSWDDLAKVTATEVTDNPQTEVVEVGAKNNFVLSLKEKTVGLVGIDDLIVVDTPDALLIAQKGRSQEIKALVDDLNKKKSKKVQDHMFDYRPWGKYEILSEHEDFKVKVITVDPGAQLSYQSHKHRSEHWVVLEGMGEVTLNEEILAVKPGSSIVIPKNSKHRIKNIGKKPLRFVEVQTGDYFGEDDIIRYADDYKRV